MPHLQSTFDGTTAAKVVYSEAAPIIRLPISRMSVIEAGLRGGRPDPRLASQGPPQYSGQTAIQAAPSRKPA